MPINLADLTRDAVFTLGHALFPYISASIGVEYRREEEFLRGPLCNGQGLSLYFHLGSTTHEVMHFEFSRTNKPPDIPAILKQWTLSNSRILLEHTITLQAPQVNPSSGTTTYHASGTATYIVQSGEELTEKEFTYPRNPTDASTKFAKTSEKLGDSNKFYTSTAYRWREDQKILLPAGAIEGVGGEQVNNNAPPPGDVNGG